MAVNPSISQLDAPQLVKRMFDTDNDALRIVLGSTTGMEISLDATSGDTVGVQGVSSSTKASITNANTGSVIAAASCVGAKTFQLYTNTTSTIVGAQLLTLEVSPSDSDNVWIATSLTVTPSLTNGVVVASATLSTLARRARVTTAAAITSGTYDVYLIKQGN